MTIADYLRQNEAEELPAWLANANPNQDFPREAFFESRIVYYPGGLYDGHPVKAFGSAGAAHCFIYADFSYDAKLFQVLDAHYHEEGYAAAFLGYHCLFRKNILEQELLVRPWNPPNIRLDYNVFARNAMKNPFALLEVLERNEDRGDEHGPRRLAILFIAGCGYATFHALFTQRLAYRPFGILVQDHGFSGNPDRFGRDGMLEQLAQQYDKYPKYLLVEDHNAWNGYRRIEGLDNEIGGMHANVRSLFVRD
jgi:hypothetical protein